MKVRLKFKKESPFDGVETILTKITEIHYNYQSISPYIQIAFESNIEQTGYTYNFEHIEEFEADI